MQALNAPNTKATDIAATVASAMRQLGVVGLPRNYEIFYEAYTGTNYQLNADLVALGDKPTQDDLDRLARKYLSQNSGYSIVETAREEIAREAEQIMVLLGKEKSSLERYGKILDKTSDGLKSSQMMTQEILQKIVGIMASATDTTVEQGRQIVSSIIDKSSELEKVKTKLEEYKRLADTDPLTQIWNRRAFDKAIMEIYGNPKTVSFAALILADIDRFKEVNDRFGHPVGDQILQVVAGILRAHVGTEMFVARTGGEEFAMIVEGTSEEATYEFADTVRRSIEETPFINKSTAASYGRITMSMGICMAAKADGPDDLYTKADRALYMSKVSGRNKVSVYSTGEQKPAKNWLLYRKD